MKKIVGSVVVLTALVLGTYYGMGVLTERNINSHLKLLNTSNGLLVNIFNYKRGWFTSHADFKWKLHIPEHTSKGSDGQTQLVASQDYEMMMPVTIYHGPVMFANNSVKFGLGYADSNVNLPTKYDQEFAEKFTAESTKPKLDLNLLITYLNHTKVELNVPNFKLFAKDGGTFDWLGLSSNVKITSKAKKIKGDAALTGLTFNKDDISTKLEDIQSDYQLHQTSMGVYLGDAEMFIKLMVMNQKDKVIFQLSDFKASTSSDIDDNLFSSSFDFSVDSLIANDETYGPGKLKIALKNLDAEVLVRINQKMTKAQQGSDLEKQQAMLTLLPELPKLLSRGAD